MKPGKPNRMRNLIILAVLVCSYLLGWGVIIYSMSDGYQTYQVLKQKRTELEKEKTALQERSVEITKKSEMRRADSPFFVEMIAREKLKMAKKGEVIIKVVKDGKTEN